MTSIKARALIFDMDGTMIDNMMIHHKAWQRKLSSLGLEMTIEEVISEIHGVNDEIINRLFGTRFSAEETKQIAWEKEKEYRAIFADKITLITGLSEFLKICHKLKIPMGIGTAAPAENVDFVLDKLNIRHYFKTIINSNMVSKGKPNPEVFLKVATGLNIPLADCLVFEDSPTGALTAANGGSSSIVITTTHKEQEFEHVNTVKGFIKDYTNCKIAATERKGWFEISF